LSTDELHHLYGMDVWDIENHIRSAVTYIASGPCPRWLACEDCGLYETCQRGCKGKRTALTYSEWRNKRRASWVRSDYWRNEN
jgi:hypothetical protein